MPTGTNTLYKNLAKYFKKTQNFQPVVERFRASRTLELLPHCVRRQVAQQSGIGGKCLVAVGALVPLVVAVHVLGERRLRLVPSVAQSAHELALAR